MRLRLDSTLIERVARLPETGIGFRFVRVRLKGGRTIAHAIVLKDKVLDVEGTSGDLTTADIARIEPSE